jgi:protein tyrosine phosphatase (PTP) superfamily phosphohydrolase (DUF442 family)/soluble cytochrome b562
MRFPLSLILLAGWLALAGCGRSPATINSRPQAPQATPQKIAAAHLPNAIRIHEKVLSGGQPDGEAGYRELKQLGVKTIISVDGAKPDVAAAKKFGINYVHLPHGYDGIPEQRARELAKAVRDLEGPIYIHCHHGHHRSPAAAAVACVSAGLIEPSAALGVLKAAGTSENYRGLYQSAEAARKLDKALLDALQAGFPETAELPPLAEAMVELETTHDHLKAIAAASWKTPASSPDLDPPHEALLLREHFTELLRSEAVQREPETFRDLLHDCETAAGELEAALQWKDAGQSSAAREKISAAFERITTHCAACHRQYRDVPLGEK